MASLRLPARLPRRLGRRLLALAGSATLLFGCGYHLQGESGLPPRIQRLHIAPFSNETFKAGVQGLVGADILRRLQLDGRLRLADAAAADAVLAGRVKGYENDAVAFERVDIGRRFRVRLVLLVTLTDQRGTGAGFKEEIVGEAFYTTGPGVVETRAAEEEATQRAAQDLAARVAARLMEDL